MLMRSGHDADEEMFAGNADAVNHDAYPYDT